MENSTIIEKHINDHINFHTSDAVKQRGKQIFKRDAAIFTSYSEKSDLYVFKVRGSILYEVHLKGIKNRSIETSCTCPFDWGSICKHAVASLLYVAKNYNSIQSNLLQLIPSNEIKKPIVNTSKRNASLAYQIKEYEIITSNFIKGNTIPYILNQLNNQWSAPRLTDFSVSDASILFKLNCQGKPITVKIYYEDEKVFITSTENIKSESLKLTEAFCLQLIANSKTPDMLDRIFNKKLNNGELQIFAKYGFPPTTNFTLYFKYAFHPVNGLYIAFNDNGMGLVPISDVENAAIFKIINNNKHEELIFDDLPSKSEERELGFALRFEGGEYRYSSNNKSNFEIIPIMGKCNKEKTILANSFDRYNEFNEINLKINKSDNANKILGLLREIEKEKSELKEFQLKQQVFHYLLSEKFVYALDAYEIKKMNLQKIMLSPESVEAFFEVAIKDDFIEAELFIKIGDSIHDIAEIYDKSTDNQIFILDEVYYFAKNYQTSTILEDYYHSFKMEKTHKAAFFQNVIKPLSKNFEMVFKEGSYKSQSVELDFNKKQVYLTEKNDHIIIMPQVEYQDGIAVMLNSTGNLLTLQNEVKITEYKRNFELEDEFIELLAEFHPQFEMQKSRKMFYLHMNDFTSNMWFYKFFDQLLANNIEVYGLKELKNFKYSPFKGKISTSVTSGVDWFEVDVNVSFGDNRVTLADIKKAVINKERYIQLKDGSVGVLPADWFHKLEKYFRNGEIKKDKLEISKLRFSIIDELFDSINDSNLLQDIAEKRKRIAEFTQISKTKVPKQINAQLRHYQMEGLNWLNFLDEMKWGGILADDMGLGKTLQILSFLQHLKNKKKSTHLIVVPTTLLFNWQSEIAKFASSLNAFYHYGTDRIKDLEHFSEYDIVFTTYGILLRDIEQLCKFKFNYVILDESQAIKNPASRRYKAANLLQANNRIAMTGTPIENGTFDLFAQMSFANRGFLGSTQAFKTNYSNPIDKDGNELVAGELQKLINPFVLRRTKEKVATELPDKTEDIIYCEMEAEQRLVYDAYRNEYKNRLLNKIESEGLDKSKMMVLEALTRLRQICDSPVLLNNDEVTSKQSVKLKEIILNITNKTAKHKILIFSQFVKMLSLVKDELSKLNIEYEYLDGKSSIKEREQAVNNFQANSDLRVFLISLKAGGTGLNLTAADYVFILDPWWNPAVENQAIDRCYRIGQDKKVFAYRMICKDTVEEKIMVLQSKKKKIAGDIIQTDENIMKSLTTGDIKELFG